VSCGGVVTPKIGLGEGEQDEDYERNASEALEGNTGRLQFPGKSRRCVAAVSTTADYIQSGFEKIDRDLEFLMQCLAEVLCELGEEEAAAVLPWMGSPRPEKLSGCSTESIEQAYSIAFQLLNMVEENAAARSRRVRESEHGLSGEPGLWTHYLTGLKEAGFNDGTIAEYLPRIRIEPVLTAHPTEAKRSAVLEQHRELYRLLSAKENQALTPSEQLDLRTEIKTTLERLWRSGEILLRKPDVGSERQSVIYYLREVFPQALARLDNRLRRAWKFSELNLELLESPAAWPRVRFGTWVGGDRDGHPLVTASVTRETLQELRLNALLVHHRNLQQMAARLPLSRNFQAPPQALEQAIYLCREELGDRAKNVFRDHPDEPWRQFAIMLSLKLPLDARTGERNELDDVRGRYRSSAELEADLKLLSDSLTEVGAARLAHTAVFPVRRALDVFGFHLAPLDIRQNSGFHDKAMAQILTAAGIDGADFPDWPEEKRLEFLLAELQSPRPFLYGDSGLGKEADAVLECYRIVRSHIATYGPMSIGAFVISMTRQLSDLLVVYVLCREVGLMRWEDGALSCEIPVVPLFETLADLQQSASLMKEFLTLPIAQRSIKLQQRLRVSSLYSPNREPVQQVMIGYSDSNKDCGIFSSQWSLHIAQNDLANVGRENGALIRFFHGRGGTISRGAGPTHRFLDALPHGSIRGDLRLTEQGETIAQKYGNLSTATYNLELLLAGVAGLSLKHTGSDGEDERMDEICELVSNYSTEAYKNLINADGFIEFYSGATPIDALEQSSIGSRPARRTGQRTLQDLRAIPWVFSWNQSRYYLPGWFGVGSGLERLENEHPEKYETLKQELKNWPFLYYVLTNVETNLASADPQLMKEYAGLVENEEARDRIYGIIQAEFDRTRKEMGQVFGGDVEHRRPRMIRTLGMRANALRILHKQQIDLLRQWRAAGDAEESGKLLPKVLLSVNAIASGLRTTG